MKLGTLLAQPFTLVDIKFTSSLTADHENLVAPELLRVVTSILNTLPIAYAIRIETSDTQIYRYSHPDKSRLGHTDTSATGAPEGASRRPARFGPHRPS